MDIPDMKPDFDTMSKTELKAYVLAHRNDDEAFYKYADRLKAASQNQIWHPCPNTPEDWEKTADLIQEQIGKLDNS